jgi:hypothetical protein
VTALADMPQKEHRSHGRRKTQRTRQRDPVSKDGGQVSTRSPRPSASPARAIADRTEDGTSSKQPGPSDPSRKDFQKNSAKIAE